MTTFNKILLVGVGLLITLNVYFYCTIVKLKTQQLAIKNPAIEQKPKIVFRTIEKFIPKEIIKEQIVDMSADERESYRNAISQLENAYFERTNEILIDEGNSIRPEIPNIQGQDNAVKKDKRFIAGATLFNDNTMLRIGYQPIKKLDLYGELGYSTKNNFGGGISVRF